MRKISYGMWSVAAAVTLFASSARAAESCGVVSVAEECATAADCGAGSGCTAEAYCDPQCGWLNGCGGGIVFQAEALFFKYHRADGVRVGSYSNVPPASTDDVEFGWEITPRLTLGYVFDSGLGFRARWWEFAHQGDPAFPPTGVGMNVDTYTVDLELFESFELNDCWTAEISGGVRYNEFDETMLDPVPPAVRVNSFTGWGGVIGLEAKRSLGWAGALYLRGRGAILMDDKVVLNDRPGADPQNAILTDSTQGMTEIALGYEYSRCVGNTRFLFRSGYEWQNWFNYSTAFTPVTTTPPDNPPADFAGPADVGFGGFTIMAGIER